MLLAAAEQERDAGAAGVDAGVVLRAAEAAGLDPGVVEAAEAAGVVRSAGGRLRFTDPALPRSAYAAAPRAHRRAAHRLLADAFGPDRCTGHSPPARSGPAGEGTVSGPGAASDDEVALGRRELSGTGSVEAEVSSGAGVSGAGDVPVMSSPGGPGPVGEGAPRGSLGAEAGDGLGGERWALAVLYHRASAAEGPAPELGDELAAAAGAEPGPNRRPTHPERAAAYARAAELAADAGPRAVRLTAAAEHARLGGLPDRARELLDAAGCEDLPEALRGAAELVRGLLSLGDGPVADARETLLLAAELLAPHDSARSRAARLAAMEAAWAAGDAAAYVEALEHPSARTDPDRRLAGYRAGMAAVMRGRLHAGRERLRGYLASGATDAADDPERLLRTGVAALVVGDLAAAGRINSRALAVARARGPYILVPQALEHLAYGELRAGRHARARAHAEEGLRSALATGQHNIAAHHHAILALAASVEGDPGAVAEHATAAERVAAPHGLVQAATLAQWARARADLGRGRVPEAAARLGPLVGPGPRHGHFAVRMLAIPCFVEASARAGEPEAARSAVAEFARWAAQGADPQAPAQLARCHALLAGPEECEPFFATALAHHDRAGGDFERGRTLLLYGAWLRRRRRPGEARGRLRDALVSFERGGALGWATQARAELRATGEAGAQEPPGPLALLTPQQLRIARCVAEGATNREVALRLSVSPRTVDHHLRNVFAALGVRSRVELSRLVDRAEKTGAHP
ncbi:LuxR C-terminal-related transcriptional regulator [Streptomyces sp. NPDC002952]|uniref:helix-turn-helix transcriptional regulator n=1 Tax=Streptomyces sp. NPDC002952 TaxID=3364673 RepID=UPI0036CFB8A1